MFCLKQMDTVLKVFRRLQNEEEISVYVVFSSKFVPYQFNSCSNCTFVFDFKVIGI